MVRDGHLSISVGNDTLGGDPAPSVRKDLSVTYSTGGGGKREVRVNEASDSTSHSLYSSRPTFVQKFQVQEGGVRAAFLLIIFICKLLCFGNR